MKVQITMTLTDAQAGAILKNAISEDLLTDDGIGLVAVGGLSALPADELVTLVVSAVNNGEVDGETVFGTAKGGAE